MQPPSVVDAATLDSARVSADHPARMKAAHPFTSKIAPTHALTLPRAVSPRWRRRPGRPWGGARPRDRARRTDPDLRRAAVAARCRAGLLAARRPGTRARRADLAARADQHDRHPRDRRAADRIGRRAGRRLDAEPWRSARRRYR